MSRHGKAEADADEAILRVLLGSDVLTDEQYALGDKLKLVENRDWWKVARDPFEFQPDGTWVYVWQTEW